MWFHRPRLFCRVHPFGKNPLIASVMSEDSPLYGENKPRKRNYRLRGTGKEIDVWEAEKAPADVLGADLEQLPLLSKSRSGEKIARKRVSLGLEPYLDAGFVMHENSTVATVEKPPWHKWKHDFGRAEKQTRGRITGFSRRSRMRMMKRLAEWDRLEDAIFITLTSPTELPFEEMKNALWAFCRRLERKFVDFGAVWK